MQRWNNNIKDSWEHLQIPPLSYKRIEKSYILTSSTFYFDIYIYTTVILLRQYNNDWHVYKYSQQKTHTTH